MWGFGTLRTFNDTIKLNRELLKANKKNPFDRKNFRTFRKKRTSFGNQKLTEAQRAGLIEQVRQEARNDKIRSLSVFLISIMIAFAIVRGIIYIIVYYMEH